MPEEITYRRMCAGEEEKVVDLVTRVFHEFVAPLFPEEGIAEFLKFVTPQDLSRRVQGDSLVLVAESLGDIIGSLELIDFSHISLFFVDGVRQKRGVGRQLMKRAVAACKKSRPEIKSLSVNSSPNAVNIYQNLGFIVSKPEQQTNGIRYVTMVLDLANALKLGYLTAGGPDRP